MDKHDLLTRDVISVLVKSGAVKSEVLGVRDERLHVALKAQPIEGKANDELLKLLKRVTGKRWEIVSGVASRRKLIKAV